MSSISNQFLAAWSFGWWFSLWLFWQGSRESQDHFWTIKKNRKSTEVRVSWHTPLKRGKFQLWLLSATWYQRRSIHWVWVREVCTFAALGDLEFVTSGWQDAHQYKSCSSYQKVGIALGENPLAWSWPHGVSYRIAIWLRQQLLASCKTLFLFKVLTASHDLNRPKGLLG